MSKDKVETNNVRSLWQQKWSNYITITKLNSSTAHITANNYIKYGNISNGMKILDLGCGHGRITKLLSLKVPLLCIFGIDMTFKLLSNFLLKTGDNGCKLKLMCADITNIPLKDDVFDVVVSSRVLHYLPDPIDGILEAHRVLRAKGKIIVTIPNKMNPIKYFTYKMAKLYTPFEIVNLMRSCGFRIINVSSICFFPSTTYFNKFGSIFEILGKIPCIKYLGGQAIIVGEKCNE